MRKLWAALAATGLAAMVAAGAAMASEPKPMPGGHVLPNPLGEQQHELLQKALQLKLEGKIPADSKVGKVAKGQYVQLQQTGEGRIFAILAEFGAGEGPLHGEMTKPDRSTDNTNIWFDSYEPQHYYDLYFDENPAANSVTNYYKAQSSGRFGFSGNVTDWVKVDHDEAYYGNNSCGSTVCSTVWNLLEDASNQWVADQLAAGKSMDEIKSYLATFDVEDRYDIDGDGNFEEPDGYLDHFQLLHAGADEAVGGGAQGTDAIWSHRWYAFYNLQGKTGPGKLGGFEIGASSGHPTGFWVGDYVMEPENAGVGVIAHETGHDYGLPDEYDTTYEGEASSAFWTIMSSGSYGNDNTNGIGNRPVDFNAWDKFQLGWLNYEVAQPSVKKSEIKLGPAEYNTKQAQAVFVVLPQKAVQQSIGGPASGEKFYYSGSGNNLDNYMYREVDVPAAGGSLTAQVRYDIEPDWDYAYVVVSTDGGSTWQSVHTNRSTTTSPNGQNKGEGITGDSGGWVDLTADLSAYAGETVLVGFRYWTDVAATYPGLSIDDISIDGGPADGAETDTGWTFDPADGGFHATTGSETQYFNQYYVVENRQYTGYDTGLRYIYNFGGSNGPNWAERFPYQDGVLVSYWDTSQADNNVGEHPGHGLILPVDVHPDLIENPDGTAARTRIQVYDATLSKRSTDRVTLHQAGTPFSFGGESGVTTFDDRGDYTKPYVADGHSDGGSDLPHTGTIIRLKSISSAGFANVSIEAAK